MNPEQLLAHFKRLTASLSTQQMLTLAGVFVAVVGVLVGSAYYINTPTYTVLFSGSPADGGRFEFNSSGTTTTLLLQGEVGHNAGRNIPCLFQQVGDRLRICYVLDGTLPSHFGAAPGEARYLATYRRGNPLDEGDETATEAPDSLSA